MATPNVSATVSAADKPPKGFSDMLLQFNMIKKGVQDNDKDTETLARKELELKLREDAIDRERTYDNNLQKLREKLREANANLTQDQNNTQLAKRIEKAHKSGDYQTVALLLQLYGVENANVSDEFIRFMAARGFLKPQKSTAQKPTNQQKAQTPTDKLKSTREGMPPITALDYKNIQAVPDVAGPTSPLREASLALTEAVGDEINLDDPATQAQAIQSPDFTSEMLMTILSGGKYEFPTQVALVSAIERYADYFTDEEKKFLIMRALSDDTDAAVYTTLLGSLENDLENGIINQSEYEVQKRELLRLQAATKSKTDTDDEDKFALPVDWSNAPGKLGEYMQKAHNIGSVDSTKDSRVIQAISLWDAYKADMKEAKPADKEERDFGQTRHVMSQLAMGTLAGEAKTKRNAVQHLYLSTFELEKSLRKVNPSDLSFITAQKLNNVTTLDELSALINDPDIRVNENLVSFFTEMKSAIQKYRQAMSGAAFTESEAKEYASMFPRLSTNMSTNMAIISGMRKSSFDNMVAFYETVYGSELAHWIHRDKDSTYTDFTLPDTNPKGLDGKTRNRPSQDSINTITQNIQKEPVSENLDIQFQSDLRARYYLTYAEAYEIVKAARAGNVYQITDEPKVRVGKDAINAPINTGTNDDTDPTTDEEIEELMGPENRRLERENSNDGASRPAPDEIELMKGQARTHFPEGPPDDQIEPTIQALRDRWPGVERR